MTIMRMWAPLGLVLLWASMALLGFVVPLAPEHIDLSKILVSGGSEEWLGYDDLGRPILDRLIMGARTSFFVAFAVVGLSLCVGTMIGTFGAFLGGWVDHALVRIIDVFLAFPGILLAIALAGVMGPGIDNVVIALSAAWIPA